jgi:rod shape-determining protein MreD
MFQNFFIFIAILATVALQVSFLPHFSPPEHVPDLLLIVVIFAAMRTDFFKILIWIILGGIVLDMSYFAPLGMNVSAFILVAFVSSFLARRILVAHGVWRFLTMFGLIIIGTFLNDWVLAILGEIISRSNFHYSLSLFFNKDIFIKILFNLIIFILIYRPLVKFSNYFNLYYSRTRVFK